jgi:AcrR family transcriptional regulator
MSAADSPGRSTGAPDAGRPEQVDPATVDLRLRRRIRAKQQVQTEALALFAKKGYQQTSVEDIADAAVISPRTFYRYFACKEDVVLWDAYDDLPLQQLWHARAGEDPYTVMVRRLREFTVQLYAQDREGFLLRVQLSYQVPEIRARFVLRQLDLLMPYYLELIREIGVPDDELRASVQVAAAFSALLVAVERWQRNDGVEDLPRLVDDALAALDDLPGRLARGASAGGSGADRP